MYKMTKLIVVLAVFGLVLAGGSAYAQFGMGVSPIAPSVERQAWDRGVFTADYLLGHMVYASANQEVGQITDFIVDQSNGRIAAVVLSDVPCLGSDKVAVPFGFLTRDQGGALKINFPENTPKVMEYDLGGINTGCTYMDAFRPGVIHGNVDTAWVDNLYRHYGYAPYWTESGDTTMALYSCGRLVGSDVTIRESDKGSTTMALTPCEISESSNVHASAHPGDTNRVAFVDDAVIERDGRISYLILSDVRGRNDELVAVPFGLVKGESGGCMLEVSQNQLASAPRFNYDYVGDRAYLGRVYSYYGVHPYWTIEDGMTR